MNREELAKYIREVIDRVLWTQNASEDNKRILTNAIVEALEKEG